MTELPPPTQAKQDFRHNWLYSVVPVFIDTNSAYQTNVSGTVLLVGYCKICDQSFAKHIPWDNNPSYLRLTKMDIPKWGCVDPAGL